VPETLQAYTRPGDDVAPNATWSLTAGTAVSGYGPERVGNRNPAKAFKATGTSATLRATFGANQVLVGVALVNHNWAGAASVAITSGSGLNEAITIPANVGGQCVNTILDFSTELLAQRTSTTFDIAVSTGVLGNVAIGEILLLTAIRDLRWSWGLKIKPRRLVKRAGDTFGGSVLQYNKRVLVHEITAVVDLQTEEAAMLAHEQEAQGEIFPWLVWPNTGDSRIHYVQFQPGTFERVFQSPGFTAMPIVAIELSQGPSLFP
jgi:hypothetical protein